MIKITNGSEVYKVTNGAYETVYKPMGFVPVEGFVSADEAAVEDNVAVDDESEQSASDEEWTDAESEVDEDAAWCDELKKKPIGQWNKTEVKRYAEIRGIDITGTKSINEAKDRIKAADFN